jgi:hypothetical protein
MQNGKNIYYFELFTNIFNAKWQKY